MTGSKFGCINSLVNFVTELGGRISHIQERDCLFAPNGFSFFLYEKVKHTVIYTGAGLNFQDDCIMIPAGALLNCDDESGICAYGTDIIKPIKLDHITVSLNPH